MVVANTEFPKPRQCRPWSKPTCSSKSSSADEMVGIAAKDSVEAPQSRTLTSPKSPTGNLPDWSGNPIEQDRDIVPSRSASGASSAGPPPHRSCPRGATDPSCSAKHFGTQVNAVLSHLGVLVTVSPSQNSEEISDVSHAGEDTETLMPTPVPPSASADIKTAQSADSQF